MRNSRLGLLVLGVIKTNKSIARVWERFSEQSENFQAPQDEGESEGGIGCAGVDRYRIAFSPSTRKRLPPRLSILTPSTLIDTSRVMLEGLGAAISEALSRAVSFSNCPFEKIPDTDNMHLGHRHHGLRQSYCVYHIATSSRRPCPRRPRPTSESRCQRDGEEQC